MTSFTFGAIRLIVFISSLDKLFKNLATSERLNSEFRQGYFLQAFQFPEDDHPIPGTAGKNAPIR